MKGVSLGVAVIAAVVVAAGCDEPPGVDVPVDVLFGDCSPSFRDRSPGFVDQMVTVAESSARRDRTFYAGCVDGAPLTTLEWAVDDVDFEEIGKAAGGSGVGAEEFKAAYAHGLGPTLRAMLDWKARVPGSGQLAALEVAAGIPGLRRVWMFTDGIVRQVGGLRLERATRAELKALADEWAARYDDGLDGVTVTFVGGGLGAPTSEVARKARFLFEQAVAGAEAVPIWSRTSPFPGGGY